MVKTSVKIYIACIFCIVLLQNILAMEQKVPAEEKIEEKVKKFLDDEPESKKDIPGYFGKKYPNLFLLSEFIQNLSKYDSAITKHKSFDEVVENSLKDSLSLSSKMEAARILELLEFATQNEVLNKLLQKLAVTNFGVLSEAMNYLVIYTGKNSKDSARMLKKYFSKNDNKVSLNDWFKQLSVACGLEEVHYPFYTCFIESIASEIAKQLIEKKEQKSKDLHDDLFEGISEECRRLVIKAIINYNPKLKEHILSECRKDTIAIYKAASGNIEYAKFSSDDENILMLFSSYMNVFIRNKLKSVLSKNIAKSWNYKTFKETASIKNNKDLIKVQFSPNGKYLFSIFKDGKAKMLHVKSKKYIGTFNSDKPVRSGIFSHDSEIILVTYDDGAEVLNLDLKPIEGADKYRGYNIRFAVFNPVLPLILVVSFDFADCIIPYFKIDIWDPIEGTCKECVGIRSPISSAMFSSDGNRIIAASYDGIAKIWDLNGKCITTLQCSLDESVLFKGDKSSPDFGWPCSSCLAMFNSTGSLAVTTFGGRIAKIWDLFGNCIATLKGHTNAIASVAFNPNGDLVTTISRNGTAKIWDLLGNCITTLKGLKNFHLEFSPNGNLLLAPSKDGTVKICNVRKIRSFFSERLYSLTIQSALNKYFEFKKL